MLAACFAWYSSAKRSNSASSICRSCLAARPTIRQAIGHRCRAARDLVDDVERALLGLHVHAAQIFAEYTHHHKLHAAKDQDYRSKTGPAGKDGADRP